MDSEFPSNSHGLRARRGEPPEPKQVKQVTMSSANRRKRSMTKRFTETFGGGSLRTAGVVVMFEILIPALKDLVAESGKAALDGVVYGEDHVSRRRAGRGRDRDDRGSYINYQSRYSSGGGRKEEPRQQLSRRSRALHDFDDIILDTKAEAEEVIDQLFELVSKYEQATVADLYKMVGVQSEFTDQKWGWTDIRGAGATRVRGGGYLLDLPRPEHLE